jgi:hypothetical protein
MARDERDGGLHRPVAVGGVDVGVLHAWKTPVKDAAHGNPVRTFTMRLPAF